MNKSYENAVSEHYTHGDLIGVIEAAITKPGKTADNVTVGDLGPVDEFHTGGQIATANLLDPLKAKVAVNDGPPPLGLHILMQESTTEKVKNMVKNIATNLIAPIEMIVQ